jgi:hypothetical protein
VAAAGRIKGPGRGGVMTGFVYIWRDCQLGKFYIGLPGGDPDDSLMAEGFYLGGRFPSVFGFMSDIQPYIKIMAHLLLK